MTCGTIEHDLGGYRHYISSRTFQTLQERLGIKYPLLMPHYQSLRTASQTDRRTHVARNMAEQTV